MFNILIVDDKSVIEKCLKQCELSVGEFCLSNVIDNVEDAIEYLKIHEVDIVLMDVSLGKDIVPFRLAKKIRKFNKHISIVIVSKCRKFEYVKQAMEYRAEGYFSLPEERDEFCTLIHEIYKKKQYRVQQEKEWRNFLFCRYLENESELNSEQIRWMFKGDANRKQYKMIVVHVLPPYRKLSHRGEDLVILKGLELLDNSFSGRENYLITKIRSNICVLVWGEKREIEDSLKCLDQFLAEIQVFNDTFIKVGAWISMGMTVEKRTDINRSFKHALEIQQERFFAKNVSVLSEVEAADDKPYYYLKVMRQTFSNCLEILDSNAIHQLLIKAKQNILLSPVQRGKELYLIYRDILFILYMEMEKAGVCLTGNIDYDHVVREFEYFWSVDEMFDALQKVIDESIAILKKEREIRESAPIRNAKQYIREFFGMPITLEEVSNYVGFNATYFSDYFKKETGMTFSQYLTETRVNFAKQLLLEDRMRIEDIAEAIGYNDKKYFAKIFKKKTGLTPKEYKRKYA